MYRQDRRPHSWSRCFCSLYLPSTILTCTWQRREGEREKGGSRKDENREGRRVSREGVKEGVGTKGKWSDEDRGVEEKSTVGAVCREAQFT